MKHYVCTGECKGVSDTPGVCRAEVCSEKGKPLVECNCTDGMHAEVKDASTAQKEEPSK